MPRNGERQGRDAEGGAGALAHSAFEPPRQARAKRSYHRMLDATVALLADRPFDDISVDEIAARAGYTKGAVYHRFEDKASLLRHVLARFTEGAGEAWDEFLDPAAWESASLEEVLDAFVLRLVAVYSRSTNLMRAFARESRWGRDPIIRGGAETLNRRILDGLTALVEARREQLHPTLRDDAAGTVRFWAATLIGALRSHYLWPDPGLDADTDTKRVAKRMRLLITPLLA